MAHREKFSLRKFLKTFDFLDVVEWAKTFSVLIRATVIVVLIAGGVFGFGYWQGQKNRPVQVDMKDTQIYLTDDEGKTHALVVKDGLMTFDGRSVKVGDIPSLKPYGIELHPKGIGGITSTGKTTVGAGLEFAHFYRLNAELLALYQFLGIGVSYDIRFDGPIKIDNSSLGIGAGRDFDTNENAVILYYAVGL